MSPKMVAFIVFCFVGLTLLSAFMEGETGFATTRLTSDVGQTDSVIYVSSNHDFASSGEIHVDNEKMEYSSKGTSPPTFTISSRGVDGTTVAEHNAWTSKNPTKVYNRESNMLNRTIEPIMSIKQLGVGPFVIPFIDPFAFLSALPQMLTWNYSFLEGNLALIKYFFLYPLSAAVVWAFLTIAINAVQGIFS